MRSERSFASRNAPSDPAGGSSARTASSRSRATTSACPARARASGQSNVQAGAVLRRRPGRQRPPRDTTLADVRDTSEPACSSKFCDASRSTAAAISATPNSACNASVRSAVATGHCVSGVPASSSTDPITRSKIACSAASSEEPVRRRCSRRTAAGCCDPISQRLTPGRHRCQHRSCSSFGDRNVRSYALNGAGAKSLQTSACYVETLSSPRSPSATPDPDPRGGRETSLRSPASARRPLTRRRTRGKGGGASWLCPPPRRWVICLIPSSVSRTTSQSASRPRLPKPTHPFP